MINLFRKKKPVAVASTETPFTITIQNKLPDALCIAIRSLEDDTFPYIWNNNGQCNCGIVVQAMTLSAGNGVNRLFRKAKEDIGISPSEGQTWKSVCQTSCSVTGMPIKEVFIKLADFGLKPRDIVHLEYMTNPAIIKESGINTKETDFYKKVANLLLYLKAWLRIIKKEADRANYSVRQMLEADLLIATAFENFDDAAEIKRKMSLIV